MPFTIKCLKFDFGVNTMVNKCKDCIYFKKYDKDKIFGYCTNNESQRKSKNLRSELSPSCQKKKIK